MEAAALGRIDRAGDIAFENNAFRFPIQIGDRDCRQEGFGIGVQGIGVNVFAVGEFNNLAQIHDRHSVADILDNAEIVRNKDIGQIAFIFDFFQGVEMHPRIFGVNLKQLINCRVSMMGLSLIFVAFAIAQYERHGLVSTSMWASVAVLVVYLFKFFWWEGGYFHSIDIMHDRFGYYICWGVLVWVPAIYCLVALWLVDHPIQWSPLVAVAMVTFGVVSIWINYNADEQRQRVRRSGGKTTVWGAPPKLIHAKYTASDGLERNSLLLVSGWWGVSRHFHYVPELMLAAAWTIPAGFTHVLPWFYWVFLFILLMDRARRDEKKCALKYGKYWHEYTAEVPYRVFPFVY